MKNITDYFGCMVFNDDEMKKRLPDATYKTLKKTVSDGKKLNMTIAETVANAMKDWAVEKGCTHYTHWFQPMTGITAEKHDSFIALGRDGRPMLEFSAKELIMGEPDASSFPSGGIRATFEARGYTAWDPTSYAFIKENTLYIPTAFCSFGGEALDKKTPLLRSMQAINVQALRILRLFGNTKVKHVSTMVGSEQEYFLIPKAHYKKRKDLVFTGRTLYGAKPPKGQELDDHYFGAIKPKVKSFMKDLDEELWRLGIYAKTEHNEAAPSQHELAPIYSVTNTANDHNQLTMETMKKVAERHDLVCLLHEKPFDGVNGSGKHNNWSLSTDTGENLLNPGTTPEANAQFLLFLCAVIKAVHEYQDILRVSIASPGNDCRLGSSEAPPAIVSIYLGTELTDILIALENKASYGRRKKNNMKIGADVLPTLPRDTSDRNRTSPFAFTGNKFEFRMLGSSVSIAGPNTVINTIVADVLDRFATKLEAAEDFQTALGKIIRKTIRENKGIIFNGNNYSHEWLAEAESRGLLNRPTTPDAAPAYIDEKNIELFKRHGIYTEIELRSRYEIILENYSKVVSIEALTMLDMARKSILPSVIEYSKMLSDTLISKTAVGSVDCGAEECMLKRVSELSRKLYDKITELEAAVNDTTVFADNLEEAKYCKDYKLPAMKELRSVADELELIVEKKYWPFPTYGDILFDMQA